MGFSGGKVNANYTRGNSLLSLAKLFIVLIGDSDFSQKYAFFSGFLLVVSPNQGVQQKDRLFWKACYIC